MSLRQLPQEWPDGARFEGLGSIPWGSSGGTRDAGRASPGQWRNGLAEGYGKFIHADGGRPGFLTSEHELGYPHGKWLVPPASLDGVTERRAIATPCEASLHSH